MKRILFLMSDTGGGHRAAAEAVVAALEIRYPGEFRSRLVDGWRHTPFPFKYSPETYEPTVRYGRLGWWAGYKITNGPTAARVAMLPMYHALFKSGMKRILRAFHDVDLIVCVHSVFVRPTVRALIGQERRPPILTIVTDLVSTHMWWYDPTWTAAWSPPKPPTSAACAQASRRSRCASPGCRCTPRFAEGLMDKAEARAALGWDADLPAVLVIGGGAGMGPLYAIARAINAKGAWCQLAVVAGRNESLKARLDAATWRQPTHIYPYVHNMPTMMAAADILVTKAGPGTISEACIAGVPIVLSGAIPGQEEGNITFVVRSGAGVWAPGPHRVADAVASWLAEGREGLARRAAAAKALGRPNAVWEIAEEVRHYASQPRVIVDERGNRRTALLPHAGSRS
ncbi:MAG: galactosyldiacylglycerol synthase [Anaerolineae bacterium]|nr:galactosyldiacylglycerol synthase [Anaerolineae bacterium]